MYPTIEAESAAERIVAVYGDGQLVTVNAAKPTYIVNAAAKGSLVLENASTAQMTIYDTFGNVVRTQTLNVGLHRVACPPSGYIALAN